jgi:hypothetical protein
MAAPVPNVTKLPLGLLGFLGIKTGGQYPSELLGSYQPVLDLLPLLIGANFEDLNPGLTPLPAAGNAGSFSAGFATPQTEVWISTLFGARVTTGGGEAWTGFLALRRFPVSSPSVVHPLSDLYTVGASTGSFPLSTKYVGWPMVIGPGDELCIFTVSMTGNPQVRGHLRFGRFPI